MNRRNFIKSLILIPVVVTSIKLEQEDIKEKIRRLMKHDMDEMRRKINKTLYCGNPGGGKSEKLIEIPYYKSNGSIETWMGISRNY